MAAVPPVGTVVLVETIWRLREAVIMNPASVAKPYPFDSQLFASLFDSVHYHRLYAHRDQAEAAGFVDALLTRLRPAPGVSVLDLGCGTGRHARRLAAKGFRVTGARRLAVRRRPADGRRRGRHEGVRVAEPDAGSRDQPGGIVGRRGLRRALQNGPAHPRHPDAVGSLRPPDRRRRPRHLSVSAVAAGICGRCRRPAIRRDRRCSQSRAARSYRPGFWAL
jgi:SAM-dependent methyltransferase